MPLEQKLAISDEDSLVSARQLARSAAKELGFGVVDQARIATGVSELARNVIRYANGRHGEVLIRQIERDDRTGLEVQVADDGPGIADVEQVLKDGYTTGSGLGMGLPGTKRLMDEMSIDTAPGRGTTVTIRKWRR
jgi:serine/threonine-protein kinase RsbT